MNWPAEAIVYTHTVVHTPPERYIADAPYEVAIVEADGRRFTVRIEAGPTAERALIGDRVAFVAERDEVAYYRLIGA